MYNSGFASVFDVPTTNAWDELCKGVEGHIETELWIHVTPVIFLRCELRSNTMHHKAYVV
jgi:hypothetical protein